MADSSVPLESIAQAKDGQRQESRSQRYVPPSLRKKAETVVSGSSRDQESLDERARRTLEDLELSKGERSSTSVDVRLKVSKDLSLDPAPPFAIRKSEGMEDPDEDGRLDYWLIPLQLAESSDQVSSLFIWFCELSSRDDLALLEFPSTLSKENRAMLHGAAQSHGLGTSSQGCGEERFLTIYPASLRNYLGTGKIPLSEEEKRRSAQIWEWIKAEGGDYLQFSRNEVEEMVVGGKLHDKLDHLEQKHIIADQLFQAALTGDIDAVNALLSGDLSLVNVTSRTHRELPLYAACTGRGSLQCPPAKMTLYLLQRGASINALNSKGQSVLHLCKQIMLGDLDDDRSKEIRDVVEVLEQNGAHDIAGWPKRNDPNKYQARRSYPTDSINRPWRKDSDQSKQAGGASSFSNVESVESPIEGAIGAMDWNVKDSASDKRNFEHGDAFSGTQRKQYNKAPANDHWAAKDRRDGGRGASLAGNAGGFMRQRQAEFGDSRAEGEYWKQGSRGGFGGDGKQRTDAGSSDWRHGGRRGGGGQWGEARDKPGWRQGGDGQGGGTPSDTAWRGGQSVSSQSREDEMAQLRGITRARGAAQDKDKSCMESDVREGSGGSEVAAVRPRAALDDDEDNMVFRPVRFATK